MATLGWVATRQLGGPAVRLPLIGVVSCAATWPVVMTTLVGARADNALAAHGKTALVTVSACEPPDRVRWRRLLASAATVPAVVIALCLPLIAATVAAIAAAIAGWRWLSDLLITVGQAESAVIAVLMLAGVAPVVRSITPIQRQAARLSARQRAITLIEASNLAADPADRRAATILVRNLQRHADTRQVAILANPRDSAVAAMYRRLGFEPLNADRPGMLLRWPQRSR
ncbi:hypothetical protein [Virgisporangium aurantiacum]|nr:hypothetical protein [Virgisporangium aurantiacum]